MIRSLAIITGAVALMAVAAPSSPSSDESAVRAVLNDYLQGQATGNGEFFRKAFYPDAKLWFVRDGKLTSVTSEEYIARASGKPAPDEAQRRRSIDMIDISGNAAVAKITLDDPNRNIVDYMTLLKVDGSWRIINKSFHVEPKTSG